MILILVGVIIYGIYYITKDKNSRRPPTQEQVLQKKSEERILKETQHFQQELERLQTIKQDTPEIQQYVETRKTTYETKLNELPKKTEQYKIESNKSGFVYIISNNKTFYRNNVFKIGMTRRDDAQKRIKELSGASVPFPYHIVAILFSDDVPTLETTLHRELAEYRLNKENRYKKEFFEIEKEKLMEVIKKHDITATFDFEK